jgi:hypothetical protein
VTEPNKRHECSSYGLVVNIDGERLSTDETNAFFIADGFPGGAAEAADFWPNGLPAGDLIHWQFTEEGLAKP